jgi:demethylmenaquinone methyltransferase/2-methoxy-6-polyprenyl-1,4-benzoquinol methylase
MSTYVLMRILESAPHRYDLGMRLLTLGGVGRAYDRLAGHVEAGQRVLDVGCGTGALALRMARRGARVKAIDVSPEMLELAARRAREAGLADRVAWVEMGVAELDGEPAGSFEVVTSGLCLSELGDDEIAYTLRQARRLLVPGGLLLLADEVTPRGRVARVLRALVRTPLVALTWLVTQQTSHAVADLEGRVASAGFEIVSRRRSGLGDFAEIVARASAAGEATP